MPVCNTSASMIMSGSVVQSPVYTEVDRHSPAGHVVPKAQKKGGPARPFRVRAGERNVAAGTTSKLTRTGRFLITILLAWRQVLRQTTRLSVSQRDARPFVLLTPGPPNTTTQAPVDPRGNRRKIPRLDQEANCCTGAKAPTPAQHAGPKAKTSATVPLGAAHCSDQDGLTGP